MAFSSNVKTNFLKKWKKVLFDFFLEKRFNRYDVAAAICMSIGLIFFTLADSKVQPIFNTYGK